MGAMLRGGGKILNGEKEGLLKRVESCMRSLASTAPHMLRTPVRAIFERRGEAKLRWRMPFVPRKKIKAVASPSLMPDGPSQHFSLSHSPARIPSVPPSLMPQKCLPNAHKITVYSTSKLVGWGARERERERGRRCGLRALQRLAPNVPISYVPRVR